MDYRGIVVRFPGWTRDLVGIRSVQTGHEIHPDSDSSCTGARFPGGKAAEVPDWTRRFSKHIVMPSVKKKIG